MTDIYNMKPLELKVWGDLACFTRPEMKVERMSYRVMTPSAARGILESIFWKPEITWFIREIQVLNPIKHISLRRNEVKSKISPRTVNSWMKQGKHDRYLTDNDRTQRNTLALKDVAYIIKSNFVLAEHAKDQHPAKYIEQFKRRVQRGGCFHRPYLGCKEFAACFSPVDGSEQPIPSSDDLGRMLFDLNYDTDEERALPLFFNARLESGILKVPLEKYKEAWGIRL